MKRSHKVLFFINSFSMGIVIPVLSLVLLAHGATLKTLSLCVGIISIVVVITEFPSGILSDIYGRKEIFLLAHFSILLSFIFIIISNNFILLAIACIFQGLGKSFSSGTIEVIEIESYMELNGKSSLPKINSSLAVIDGIGLASGSFCGGLIGYIGTQYTILLLVCIILEISIILITIFIIKKKKKTETQSIFTIKQQLNLQFKNIRSTLYDANLLIIILVGGTLLGVGLSVVEVYWQPTLEIILPKKFNWIFGIINCLGYIGVILGNKAAELYWKHINLVGDLGKLIRCYWILRLVLPILITSLGLCENIYIFFFVFIMIYFIVGASNLFENTLFHNLISNTNRSSMMSLSSLFLRGGGIITSVLGGLILSYTSLSFVWILLPFIMCGGIAILWYKSINYRV